MTYSAPVLYVCLAAFSNTDRKYTILMHLQEEVCLQTFIERITGDGAPPPLTQQEQELRDMNRQGVRTSSSTCLFPLQSL